MLAFWRPALCIIGMAFQRDIDKGAGEVIRLEISEFKGKKLFNIRIWYTDKESGQLRPTQKGVTIRPEQFGEIKQAVLDAEAEIQDILAQGG